MLIIVSAPKETQKQLHFMNLKGNSFMMNNVKTARPISLIIKEDVKIDRKLIIQMIGMLPHDLYYSGVREYNFIGEKGYYMNKTQRKWIRYISQRLTDVGITNTIYISSSGGIEIIISGPIRTHQINLDKDLKASAKSDIMMKSLSGIGQNFNPNTVIQSADRMGDIFNAEVGIKNKKGNYHISKNTIEIESNSNSNSNVPLHLNLLDPPNIINNLISKFTGDSDELSSSNNDAISKISNQMQVGGYMSCKPPSISRHFLSSDKNRAHVNIELNEGKRFKYSGKFNITYRDKCEPISDFEKLKIWYLLWSNPYMDFKSLNDSLDKDVFCYGISKDINIEERSYDLNITLGCNAIRFFNDNNTFKIESRVVDLQQQKVEKLATIYGIHPNSEVSNNKIGKFIGALKEMTNDKNISYNAEGNTIYINGALGEKKKNIFSGDQKITEHISMKKKQVQLMLMGGYALCGELINNIISNKSTVSAYANKSIVSKFTLDNIFRNTGLSADHEFNVNNNLTLGIQKLASMKMLFMLLDEPRDSWDMDYKKDSIKRNFLNFNSSVKYNKDINDNNNISFSINLDNNQADDQFKNQKIIQDNAKHLMGRRDDNNGSLESIKAKMDFERHIKTCLEAYYYANNKHFKINDKPSKLDGEKQKDIQKPSAIWFPEVSVNANYKLGIFENSNHNVGFDVGYYYDIKKVNNASKYKHKSDASTSFFQFSHFNESHSSVINKCDGNIALDPSDDDSNCDKGDIFQSTEEKKILYYTMHTLIFMTTICCLAKGLLFIEMLFGSQLGYAKLHEGHMVIGSLVAGFVINIMGSIGILIYIYIDKYGEINFDFNFITMASLHLQKTASLFQAIPQ